MDCRSIFMLSLAKEGQYYQVFLSQGLGMGIGTGIMYTPTSSVVAHHFKKRRSIAMVCPSRNLFSISYFMFTGSHHDWQCHWRLLFLFNIRSLFGWIHWIRMGDSDWSVCVSGLPMHRKSVDANKLSSESNRQASSIIHSDALGNSSQNACLYIHDPLWLFYFSSPV